MPITINFSSQWPTIQVAKVYALPHNAGEADQYPYIRKIPHGLGYPPLAIGMAPNNGSISWNNMVGLDVDDTYVYIDDFAGLGQPTLDCAIVYALDISNQFNYSNYTSEIGDVAEDDTGGTLDLRKFLLHSRAVGPMVLSVMTNTYNKDSLDGLKFEYTHPLNYPIFNFGYLRVAITEGILRAGIWMNAPLAGQAWPVMVTDGFKSELGSTIQNGQYESGYGSPWIPGTGTLIADKGSIITLRNPAIITENTVTVNI